ncbi:MAG: hypothetical protein ACUVX8_05015 [Candidatus Zipacnadales bacterium]
MDNPHRARPFPVVLPVRERAGVMHRVLEKRLETVLPMTMREADLDMWLILCQEDNLDPVFNTLIPFDTWCPILQMVVFYDNGDSIERISISGTNMRGLYDQPLSSQLPEEQWPILIEVIQTRDPQRIGINIGSVEWAAGGRHLQPIPTAC